MRAARLSLNKPSDGIVIRLTLPDIENAFLHGLTHEFSNCSATDPYYNKLRLEWNSKLVPIPI